MVEFQAENFLTNSEMIRILNYSFRLLNWWLRVIINIYSDKVCYLRFVSRGGSEVWDSVRTAFRPVMQRGDFGAGRNLLFFCSVTDSGCRHKWNIQGIGHWF